MRRLNWATYSVDADGKNRYPNDDIWLTDGYGDYVRHYLRAMASFPELAPMIRTICFERPLSSRGSSTQSTRSRIQNLTEFRRSNSSSAPVSPCESGAASLPGILRGRF